MNLFGRIFPYTVDCLYFKAIRTILVYRYAVALAKKALAVYILALFGNCFSHVANKRCIKMRSRASVPITTVIFSGSFLQEFAGALQV